MVAIIENDEDLLIVLKEKTIEELIFKDTNLNVLDNIYFLQHTIIKKLVIDNCVLGNLSVFFYKNIDEIELINLDLSDSYCNLIFSNISCDKIKLENIITNNEIYNLLKHRTLNLSNMPQGEIKKICYTTNSYKCFILKNYSEYSKELLEDMIMLFSRNMNFSIMFENLKVKNLKSLETIIRKKKIDNLLLSNV